MKKLLLMFLSAFSIISCVDIESADFEDEIYEPKELKVKSVFLKWIDDDYINMVSTKTDYYYGAENFQGKHIHIFSDAFPTWESVLDELISTS